jgi:hypothetical protein
VVYIRGFGHICTREPETTLGGHRFFAETIVIRNDSVYKPVRTVIFSSDSKSVVLHILGNSLNEVARATCEIAKMAARNLLKDSGRQNDDLYRKERTVGTQVGVNVV